MKRTFLLGVLAVALLAGPVLAAGLDGLLPAQVGELKRIELLTGVDAQAEVDKLHGKPLPAEASAVARYSRPGDVGVVRPAEVWVSEVSSEKEARRQTGLMVHKMYENPRSPFKNPSRIDQNGMAVYRFEGMGQAHLIWFKEKLVYWISCAPEDEALMLEAFCQ